MCRVLGVDGWSLFVGVVCCFYFQCSWVGLFSAVVWFLLVNEIMSFTLKKNLQRIRNKSKLLIFDGWSNE